MSNRKKPTSFKKRFRSDILIDEQVNKIFLKFLNFFIRIFNVNISLWKKKTNFLKSIENELTDRKLGHKVVKLNDQNDLFEYLFRNDTIDFKPTKANSLKSFNFYEEEEHSDLKQQSPQSLLQTYKKNLIRCHVILFEFIWWAKQNFEF